MHSALCFLLHTSAYEQRGEQPSAYVVMDDYAARFEAATGRVMQRIIERERSRRRASRSVGDAGDDSQRSQCASERLAARRALTQQADASQQDSGKRERALRTLANTAEHIDSIALDVSHGRPDMSRLPLYDLDDVMSAGYRSFLRLFWEENKQVLVAGARDEVLAVRRESLRALCSLPADDAVARAMWSDENGARAALQH